MQSCNKDKYGGENMYWNNQNGYLTGLEFMGDNIRSKLKYCGEGVRLYPLCKMIHAESASLDNEAKILDNVFIDAGKEFIMGKYSMITWFTLIEGGGKTYICDRVFVGPGSKILNSTYKLNGYYAMEWMPEGCNEIEYGDIFIEDDAYLGANSTILPGITIHEGAVVGANTLVNKDLESWGIYVGTPCRKIGERKKPSAEQKEKTMTAIDWSNHLYTGGGIRQ